MGLAYLNKCGTLMLVRDGWMDKMKKVTRYL